MTSTISRTPRESVDVIYPLVYVHHGFSGLVTKAGRNSSGNSHDVAKTSRKQERKRRNFLFSWWLKLKPDRRVDDVSSIYFSLRFVGWMENVRFGPKSFDYIQSLSPRHNCPCSDTHTHKRLPIEWWRQPSVKLLLMCTDRAMWNMSYRQHKVRCNKISNHSANYVLKKITTLLLMAERWNFFTFTTGTEKKN